MFKITMGIGNSEDWRVLTFKGAHPNVLEKLMIRWIVNNDFVAERVERRNAKTTWDEWRVSMQMGTADRIDFSGRDGNDLRVQLIERIVNGELRAERIDDPRRNRMDTPRERISQETPEVEARIPQEMPEDEPKAPSSETE